MDKIDKKTLKKIRNDQIKCKDIYWKAIETHWV